MKDEVEIIKVDDKCTLEFSKSGLIKIGDCKDAVLNPVEIHLLDRVNQVLDESENR